MDLADEVLELFFGVTEKIRVSLFTNSCCCSPQIVKVHPRLPQSLQEPFPTVGHRHIKVQWVLAIVGLIFGNPVVLLVTNSPGPELCWVSLLRHEQINCIDLFILYLSESHALTYGEKPFQLIGRHSQNGVGLQGSL